ncbi:hypothetical protein E5676_scaffold453G001040 [Cucumis melo var. makuwa]|uniref:Uncharacterized protein n=1 Tax=Cucumis melo var. makuwa TaxID=1194695 RepID=A0A5D3C8D5_CUCMM|nr:hypothetical protein E6C27_scaffold86G001090 [Cucumis melo var. makuwa]TYK06629.1 hypothetical protein E5676_scaffold453G001040 [Cucumis melo var. makuwa]
MGSLNQATAYELPAQSSTGTWSESWSPPTAWKLTISSSISLSDGVGLERKLMMLSATGLSPSRVQHSTTSPNSMTIVLFFHSPIFTIQQQFERLTSGSTLICNSPKHFVTDYTLPRLWVPRYPLSTFLPLNLILHFKAMPSPCSGATKWRDLINEISGLKPVTSAIGKALPLRPLTDSTIEAKDRQELPPKATYNFHHTVLKRNSSLYLKRYHVVGWNPILTKDSCGFGESSYRRTRKE